MVQKIILKKQLQKTRINNDYSSLFANDSEVLESPSQVMNIEKSIVNRIRLG